MRYLLFTFLLVACGSSPDKPLSDEINWSGVTTEKSRNFIISYDEKSFDSKIKDVEDWWLAVQKCSGISADISEIPLRIDYLDTFFVREEFMGWIYPANRVTQVSQYDLTFPLNGWVTRHEQLHYLLHVVGVNDKENLKEHSHPAWDKCLGTVSP